MSKRHDVAVWFEIPVLDMVRAKRFYEKVLDIKMVDMPLSEEHEMCLFSVATGVSGALCRHGEFYEPSMDGSLVYLNGGKDLQVPLDRVEKAGGKILMPKKQISPEHGFMAMFEDIEGNRVALHSTS